MVNAQNGEVKCPYCRSVWVEPRIARGALLAPFEVKCTVIKDPAPLSEREAMEITSGFRAFTPVAVEAGDDDSLFDATSAKRTTTYYFIIFVILLLALAFASGLGDA